MDLSKAFEEIGEAISAGELDVVDCCESFEDTSGNFLYKLLKLQIKYNRNELDALGRLKELIHKIACVKMCEYHDNSDYKHQIEIELFLDKPLSRSIELAHDVSFLSENLSKVAELNEFYPTKQKYWQFKISVSDKSWIH